MDNRDRAPNRSNSRKAKFKIIENMAAFLFLVLIFVSLGFIDQNKIFPGTPKLSVSGKNLSIRTAELPFWLLLLDIGLFLILLILGFLQWKQTRKVGKGLIIAVIGLSVEVLLWLLLGWQFGAIES